MLAYCSLATQPGINLERGEERKENRACVSWSSWKKSFQQLPKICTMKTSVASLLFATVATRTSAFAPASRSTFSRWVRFFLFLQRCRYCSDRQTTYSNFFFCSCLHHNIIATCLLMPYPSPMAPCPLTECAVNGGANTLVTKRLPSLSRPLASLLMNTCLQSRLHPLTPQSTVWFVEDALTSSLWLL